MFQGNTPFHPFVQQLFERGKLDGLREALLRLLARAAISLTEDQRALIQACTDAAILDR